MIVAVQIAWCTKTHHNCIQFWEKCWCASTRRGVIANELKWDETYQTSAGSQRALPIPGRDLSGVVEEVGPGVTTLAMGSEVYAMLGYGRDGAEADYTIAPVLAT